MLKYSLEQKTVVKITKDLKYKVRHKKEYFISTLKSGTRIELAGHESGEYRFFSPDGYIGFIDTEILDANSIEVS